MKGRSRGLPLEGKKRMLSSVALLLLVASLVSRVAGLALGLAPKLQPDNFKYIEALELRGVKAVEPIASGETIAVLPRQQALAVVAGEGTPSAAFVSTRVWEKQPLAVKLALKLLYERGLGSSSRVAEYIQALPPPESFQTLVHWTDQELDALCYPAVADAARRQRQAWDTLHDDLIAAGGAGPGSMLSKEDVIWALDCVLSRAFTGDFGGGRNTLIAATAVACLGATLGYLSDSPLALAATAVAVLALNAKELTKLAGGGGGGGGDCIVLLPTIDSINHRTELRSELDFDPLRVQFAVKAGRAFQPGEQVFMSYGPKTNDELLQFFGFVEVDNPADCYFIPCLADFLRPFSPSAQKRAAKLGKAKDPVLKDAAKTGLTFGRSGRIAREDTAAAALRALCCEDSEYEKRVAEFSSEKSAAAEAFRRPLPNEGAAWAQLAEALRQDQARLAGGGSGGSGAARQELARLFRVEKQRVLAEALAAVERRAANPV